MVRTKVNKRKAVKRTVLRNTLISFGIILFFAVGAVGVYFAISYFLTKNSPIEAESTAVELEPEPGPEPETVVVLPDKIDFQPVVDGWVGGAGGNKSVLIYDLERNEVVSAYNATENYNTASLYKLFVVYEGYRRVQSGEWQASDPAGSTGYTILKCLDIK